jgi:hypothetical protein
MKTPSIRHASIVGILAIAAVVVACTDPSVGGSGGASGQPEPAVSPPGTVDPAMSSDAPAGEDEYTDEYSAP